MAGHIRLFLLFLCALLLAACTNGTQNIVVNSPEAQRRAVIKQFGQKLVAKGGSLVQVGDTVNIVFPSQLILNPCSANLNPSYCPLLNEAAQLMRGLETVSVEVAGYTNCRAMPSVNKALSKRQAEVVSEYLFERGLDARLVYAVGYGAQNPVVLRPVGSDINRRIVISFQYIPLERPNSLGPW